MIGKVCLPLLYIGNPQYSIKSVSISCFPPLSLLRSVSYFCSFIMASLHTPSIFSFGSAIAALSFLQHELHSQVQQCMQHRDVQDQQQCEHAALCSGLLRFPALPAAQRQLLR